LSAWLHGWPGYETTANTLAYCVYNIAAHPEVEARLLAEVDAYGRGRKVQYRDLDQVRC
jgi:pentalenene oxygenase